MIAFDVQWDASTMAQFVQFVTSGQDMQTLMDDLSDEFGRAGVEFIKDAVHGNVKWQPSTGKTAAGISFEVERGVFGQTVHFLGSNMSDDGRHNIATLIDVGNFDEDTELWAAGPGNGLGFKAFPISLRAGAPAIVHTFLPFIHGMGHSSPEYPKFFSDNAVYELRDRTPNLAESHLQAFLDRLVV